MGCISKLPSGCEISSLFEITPSKTVDAEAVEGG